MAYLRSRKTVILLKAEVTEGTDSAPAATDGILHIDGTAKLTPKPNIVDTNEAGASLDGLGSLIGGMTFDFSFDVWMKGVAAASIGAAPEMGPALKSCGWSETLVSATVPAGGAEAGAAGSATSLTLAAGATATAQLYRYMPITLAVNPATPVTPFISDYTAAKVATLTDTFSPVLDSSTTYVIPKHALYIPGSSSIPSCTIWVYNDGIVYKLVGNRGDVSFMAASGGGWKASFRFTGMFSAKADLSLITPTYAGVAIRPPLWKNNVMLINRLAAAVKTFNLKMGNTLTNPDNPNSLEGFDPSQIVRRKITGDMDPTETLVATRDIMGDFRAGTPRILSARVGSTVGNRMAFTIAQGLYTGQTPADRSGISNVAVPFEAVGQDSGVGLAFY